MTEQEQAKFDGWAIVDVLGHQRYVGYVRTEAYGAAVLFRVDVPELPEREYQLKKPEYIGNNGDVVWTPAGSTVQRAATPGYTKLIGAGSIYSISPCDEAAALKAVEAAQPAQLKLVSLPANVLRLSAPDPDPSEEDDDEEADDEYEPDLDDEDEE